VEQSGSGSFYNSSCRPQVKNGQDLFVVVDWLVWQASELNLAAWQEGGIADVQLGLRWDYGFSQDRFQIRLQAGWENHIFFDNNCFYNFTTNTSVINNLGGDLGFQGWFLSGRFDF